MLPPKIVLPPKSFFDRSDSVRDCGRDSRRPHFFLAETVPILFCTGHVPRLRYVSENLGQNSRTAWWVRGIFSL